MRILGNDRSQLDPVNPPDESQNFLAVGSHLLDNAKGTRLIQIFRSGIDSRCLLGDKNDVFVASDCGFDGGITLGTAESKMGFSVGKYYAFTQGKIGRASCRERV